MCSGMVLRRARLLPLTRSRCVSACAHWLRSQGLSDHVVASVLGLASPGRRPAVQRHTALDAQRTRPGSCSHVELSSVPGGTCSPARFARDFATQTEAFSRAPPSSPSQYCPPGTFAGRRSRHRRAGQKRFRSRRSDRNPAVACVSGSPNTDSATVTYTPNANVSGSDSFAFQGQRRHGGFRDGHRKHHHQQRQRPADGQRPSGLTTNEDNDLAIALAARYGDLRPDLQRRPRRPTARSFGSIGTTACMSGSPNTDSATVTYTPNANYLAR